jgi:hypothetical protein
VYEKVVQDVPRTGSVPARSELDGLSSAEGFCLMLFTKYRGEAEAHRDSSRTFPLAKMTTHTAARSVQGVRSQGGGGGWPRYQGRRRIPKEGRHCESLSAVRLHEQLITPDVPRAVDGMQLDRPHRGRLAPPRHGQVFCFPRRTYCTGNARGCLWPSWGGKPQLSFQVGASGRTCHRHMKPRLRRPPHDSGHVSASST